MNLLLKRSQNASAWFSLVPLRIGKGVIFQLHAELELDTEEFALLHQYRFADTHLVVSDPMDDLRRAFRPALFLGLLGFVVVWIVANVMTAIPAAFLVTLVMTVVYFRTLREQIKVSDLTEGGRTFYCDSIIALIHKEAYLEFISGYLRQVLESAKHWDDREAIAIPPLDKAAAKEAVLKTRVFHV